MAEVTKLTTFKDVVSVPSFITYVRYRRDEMYSRNTHAIEGRQDGLTSHCQA